VGQTHGCGSGGEADDLAQVKGLNDAIGRASWPRSPEVREIQARGITSAPGCPNRSRPAIAASRKPRSRSRIGHPRGLVLPRNDVARGARGGSCCARCSTTSTYETRWDARCDASQHSGDVPPRQHSWPARKPRFSAKPEIKTAADRSFDARFRDGSEEERKRPGEDSGSGADGGGKALAALRDDPGTRIRGGAACRHPPDRSSHGIALASVTHDVVEVNGEQAM